MQPEYPTTEDEIRLQCRHIFTDGRRCGSPALRSPGGHENFCYFHHNSRRPIQDAPARKRRRSSFALSNPCDLSERSGIQLSLAEVLQKIAANEIDPRRAGLLLYGLQIASLNLPRPDPNARPREPISEVVLDPEHGLLAPPAELGHDEPIGSAQRLLMELDAGEDESERNRRREAELRRASADAAADAAATAARAAAESATSLDIQAGADSRAPETAPEPRPGSEANSPAPKILRKKVRGGGHHHRLLPAAYPLSPVLPTSSPHASAGKHGTPSPRSPHQTHSGTAASPHASAQCPC
ncbi:MAG TPA: hypothetical protein VFA99_09335 [Acidobacteriaceae bacterium]|nr:hypothetical protein [Acidobacteriaceae bacterium]